MNQLSQDIQDYSNDVDVGLFVGKKFDNAVKYKILTSPFMPNIYYNYKANVTSGKICFLLALYYDWLCYSTVLKGTLSTF